MLLAGYAISTLSISTTSMLLYEVGNDRGLLLVQDSVAQAGQGVGALIRHYDEKVLGL